MNPMMEHYKEGKGTIAMVGSILTGTICLTGPLASLLINKFGPKYTCMGGAIVSAVFIFLSTFSPNVYLLMVSYGVLGGLGLGLMYVPAVTAVGYWFEKKRSLVTGISTCGSGFGTIVFAPVVTALKANLGWQWCNRIVACFCLACTFLGLTMKSVPDKREHDEEKFNPNKRPILKKGVFKKDEIVAEEVEAGQKPGAFAVFKSYPYLLVAFANLPALMALYIPYMFIPGMTQQRGLNESQSALLISLIGFFNTGGRIISGAVTDHPRVDALFVSTLSLGLGGAFSFLMVYCFDFWSLSVVCILFGLFLSAWIAVTSPLLVDLLGLDLLTSAFGILTFVRGIAALLGPPLAGFVIDITSVEAASSLDVDLMTKDKDTSLSVDQSKEDKSNYEVSFYICSFLFTLASIIHLLAFFIHKAQCRRKPSNNIAS